jgi:hypothetical protein
MCRKKLTEVRDRMRRKKGRKKGREGAKVTERKMTNMQLLEECKSRSKGDVRIDEKEKSDGKRAEKSAEGAKSDGTKDVNMHLLEACNVILKCA